MITDIETIKDVVMRERKLSVSEREWKHRIKGYGYAIRESGQGRMVTSVRGGQDLCALGA